MATDRTPFFLVIQVPDLVAAVHYFQATDRAVARSGGTLFAAGLPRDVEVLEAGTRLDAVWIARWPTRDALDAYWNTAAQQLAFAAVAGVSGSLAVAVKGVPAEGLPGDFLPTVATVDCPQLVTPPAYMLIQGRVIHAEPLTEYVNIIMPMLRDRDGYYVVYARAADVSVLYGRWSEEAFIVSRWPTLEAARDFWYSERYQNVAIPVRTGHGAFTVLLCPGLAG